MQKVQEVAKALNIVPRLQLGEQLPAGGVKSTGAHIVKFIAEPTVVMGKSTKTGKPRKEFRFIVTEGGKEYRWNVPITNDEGSANYLVERLMNIEVGDEKILEMVSKKGRNYIDIRDLGEDAKEIDESDEEVNIEEDEPGEESHGE